MDDRSLSLHSYKLDRTHKNNKMSNYCYKTEKIGRIVMSLSWSSETVGSFLARVVFLEAAFNVWNITINFSLSLSRLFPSSSSSSQLWRWLWKLQSNFFKRFYWFYSIDMLRELLESWFGWNFFSIPSSSSFSLLSVYASGVESELLKHQQRGKKFILFFVSCEKFFENVEREECLHTI